MPKALFIGINVKEGSRQEIEAFLRNAVTLVEAEPETRDWYALKFPDTGGFALFDTFTNHVGRLKHMVGGVGRGIAFRSLRRLQSRPDFQPGDLIAAKLPDDGPSPTVATYTHIETRLADGREFGEFLVGAAGRIRRLAHVRAWYAVRMERCHYALLSVFNDETGYETHMTSPEMQSLRAQASAMVELPLSIRRAEILASKQSGWEEMMAEERAAHRAQPEQRISRGMP